MKLAALALIALLSGCAARSTTTAPPPTPAPTVAETAAELQAELDMAYLRIEAEKAARGLALEKAKTEAAIEKATAVTRARQDHEQTVKAATGWAIGVMATVGVGLFVASFFVPFIQKKDGIGVLAGAGSLIIARSMLVRFGFDFAAWAFWILVVVGVVVGLYLGILWVRRVFTKEADKLETKGHAPEAVAIRATLTGADSDTRKAMLKAVKGEA